MAPRAFQPVFLRDPNSGCMISGIDPALDSATWSGQCIDGAAGGPGTATFLIRGRFAQSLTGVFSAGALRDGHAVLRWADGTNYEGDVVSGRMDGLGILVTASGNRFEGQWSDGHLKNNSLAVWPGRGEQQTRPQQNTASNIAPPRPDVSNIQSAPAAPKMAEQTADAVPPPPVKAPSPTPAVPDDDARSAPHDPPRDLAPPIQDIAGQKFYAVDGTSLTLAKNDDNLIRVIAAPNGTPAKVVFVFLNDKVGSVSEGDDDDKVAGVFRLNEKGIVTDYSDGHSEIFGPNRSGGVSMIVNAPGGGSRCVAWYPEGHRFSLDERKAALSAYAAHLGLPDSAHKAAKTAPEKPDCATSSGGTGWLTRTASASSSPSKKEAKPAPRPDHQAALPVTHALPASFIMPLPSDADEPVTVRNSVVHKIDADPAPQTRDGETQASNEPVAKGGSASSCLSVESDGLHWGFHNHCSYDVQFVYCLANNADPLASCSKGAVSGSVAPNGSSALIADKSLSETDADHDFRWVACGGGAGEVVVHLDRVDPPVGRCVRPGAS